MALLVNGSTHLIPAYYSFFIDPERIKGWVGLVGWPIADGLPTFVVNHQLQVERRTGKVRRPETDVLPLCHATPPTCSKMMHAYRPTDYATYDAVVICIFHKESRKGNLNVTRVIIISLMIIFDTVNSTAKDNKLVQTSNQKRWWTLWTYSDSVGFCWSTYHWYCSEAVLHPSLCLHQELKETFWT